MSNTDLSTATTDEIINELEARCDSFVFAGIFKCDQRTEGATIASVYWHGGMYTAIGLCATTERDLREEMHKVKSGNG